MNRFKSWWRISGRGFLTLEWRRLLIGCAIGWLIAIAVHLAFWDSVFVPALQGKWTPKQKFFRWIFRIQAGASTVLIRSSCALVGACCYCHLALSARLVSVDL